MKNYRKVFSDPKSDYYLVQDVKTKKYAIFHATGERVSDWYNYINDRGLLRNESPYYVVLGDPSGSAIFHVDGKKRVFYVPGYKKIYPSESVTGIYPSGLVTGESPFFLITEEIPYFEYYVCDLTGTKFSIGASTGLNNLLSGCLVSCAESIEEIKELIDALHIRRDKTKERPKILQRLLSSPRKFSLDFSKLNYYVVEKNDKFAIFHKSGKQISDWYEEILPDGLVLGESNYYVARKDVGAGVDRLSIYDSQGKELFHVYSDDYIYPRGLVTGESNFFLVCDDDGWHVCDLSGPLLERIPDPVYLIRRLLAYLDNLDELKKILEPFYSREKLLETFYEYNKANQKQNLIFLNQEAWNKSPR